MKKFLLLALPALFITGPVIAQEPVDLDITQKIRDEGLNRSKVMQTAFILTDVSGPRLTGSPGLKKAQEWMASELKAMGLKNVAIEPWGKFGKGWQIDKNYVAMTAPYYDALIAYPKAWSGSTNGPYKGEVILVKADSAADLQKYAGKLTGKAVIFDVVSQQAVGNIFDPDGSRNSDERLTEMAAAAALPVAGQRGGRPGGSPGNFASALSLRQSISRFLAVENPGLVINLARGADGTMFTSNGNSYADTAKAAGPELEMSGEDYLRLLRIVKSGRKVEIEADIRTSFFSDDLNQYNVIGEIPGTDPKLKSELVMLGGHFDSWHSGTGATDNAAGSAVMVEAMRILKALNLKPKRTIRIALWSGEEQGIFGSKNYVKNHFADPANMSPLVEHDKLSAYYNLDNGTGKIRGIYLQGNAAARPIFQAWLDPFKDLGAGTVTINNTGGTDHLSFDAVGLPGFQFIQDSMDYGTRTHHSNQDTYDRLSEDDLKQAATIVASLVYNTAQMSVKMPRKAMPEAKP